MKRLFAVMLTFALAGCGAIAPTPSTPSPTGTPETILQTVVVTVLVTQVVTETPSSTPTATLTAVATLTSLGTAETATTTTPSSTDTTPATPVTASPTASGSATATLPADAGGGVFTNITRSSDHLALNCQPNTVTFGITTTNSAIAEVDLFYRIEDQLSSSISGWVDIGKMTPDQAGNFSMDFAASLVDPDIRTHKAWLDYQFVGISKTGEVLGRSARIVKQIAYTIECSD